MRKIISILILGFFVFAGVACDTNKPADEVKDAQERVKKKVEEGRQQQQEAAEEAAQ